MALTKIKGAGINISATEKLYFDGGGNTYIHESAADVLKLVVGGVAFMDATEGTNAIVFNEGSVDMDFRVESNGNANMLFVDGGNDRVGIGIGTPSVQLEISGSADQQIRIDSTSNRAQLQFDGTKTSDAEFAEINFANAGDSVAAIHAMREGANDAARLAFFTQVAGGAVAEKMTITSAGNVEIAGGELHNTSGEFTFRNTTDGENISFRTQAANTERLKIHSGGNVEVKTGDLVIGTAGKGISFAATSDGTTMSSELLDDYEEGTYTGAITIATGTMGVGTAYDTLSYTKIGDVVHVFGQLVLSAPSGDAAGATSLNLPFTSVNLNDLGGRAIQANLIYLTGSAITNGLFTTYMEIMESSASCRIFFVDAGASTTENIGDNHAGEGTDIFINLTYKAA